MANAENADRVHETATTFGGGALGFILVTLVITLGFAGRALFADGQKAGGTHPNISSERIAATAEGTADAGEGVAELLGRASEN